jgi:hypothetical protein
MWAVFYTLYTRDGKSMVSEKLKCFYKPNINKSTSSIEQNK